MASADARQGLAERLVASTDWSSYRRLGGDAAGSIGSALLALLSAERETVGQIRNHIENEVAVQANLYSAAEPAIRILGVALGEDRPRWVRIPALDLMYLILTGAPAPQEVELGEKDLQNRCVAAARESLWSIVRVAEEDSRCLRLVLDVLRLIDPESPSIRMLDSG